MAALPQDVAVVVPRRSPAPRSTTRRQLRLAPPRKRGGRYVALMVVMAAMGVFGSVTLNALAAEQSFAVRELEHEVRDLTRTADELIVDVTRLQSPRRLERAATNDLGMVPGTEPGYVLLPGGASDDSGESSSTMAAPPAPKGDGAGD
ncbi:MAG TPA: hypothetical protein VM307_01570 [Egibacteraceae bacterium]|nr:hypothetical protein [Egibacteraceae bacterium]